MLNLEASFKIEYISNISDIDKVFQEITTLYRSFVYDLKYIFIETKFTHRLLKKKSEYVYENLRKTLEDDPNVVIVETDLTCDPKLKNAPIIKNVEFYKNLIKYFDGYVAFKYHGPLQQIKQCIDYLQSFRYCDFCSYTMMYQIDLYKVYIPSIDKESSYKDESINFIYIKVLTA